MMKQYFWLGIGHFALLLGLIGVFLPVMPTAPFVILASYCYSRGSPRFEKWLIEHPRLGPQVLAWREHGVIKRTPKVLATLGLLISVPATLCYAKVPLVAKALVVVVVTLVMTFIWSRPEAPRTEGTES